MVGMDDRRLLCGHTTGGTHRDRSEVLTQTIYPTCAQASTRLSGVKMLRIEDPCRVRVAIRVLHIEVMWSLGREEVSFMHVNPEDQHNPVRRRRCTHC